MRKGLLIVLLSGLTLAGCVAVPAYDGPYYGPPAYVDAPAVYAQPYVGFSFYSYDGGWRHREHERWEREHWEHHHH